jgi:acetyl esterase/lipase
MKNLLLCLLPFVLLACSSSSTEEPTRVASDDTGSIDTSVTETVTTNVSYSAVTALPFRPADHKIQYGQSEFEFAELWLPSSNSPDQTFPMVIFIHGGCWLNAFDIKHTYPLSTALAERGIAVFSLEYRRTGDIGGGWPGTFEDIQRGVDAGLALSQYPIDQDKVVLSGHSAGGHLALLAGAKIDQDKIKGVIGLAAIFDILEYSRGSNSCQSAAQPFMGGDEFSQAAAYEQANPAGMVLHPFSLLLQGSADGIVPQSQATLSGIPFQISEGAGHFDWVHTQTAAFYSFLKAFEDMVNQ